MRDDGASSSINPTTGEIQDSNNNAIGCVGPATENVVVDGQGIIKDTDGNVFIRIALGCTVTGKEAGVAVRNRDFYGPTCKLISKFGLNAALEDILVALNLLDGRYVSSIRHLTEPIV